MKLLWFYSRIECKDNLCRPFENSKQQNAACLLGRSSQASLGLLGLFLPREQAAAVLACKLATLPRTGRSFTASPWLWSFSATSARALHPLMCSTSRAGRMSGAMHSRNIRTDQFTTESRLWSICGQLACLWKHSQVFRLQDSGGTTTGDWKSPR